MTPLVSVIVSTYNRKEYIAKAINSILNQTFKDLEIIIIDDASKDGTDKVVSELIKKSSNILAVKNQVNLGFVKTLNKGIEVAKGKYIARLDDDDYWYNSQKLEKQIKFFENNPEYALVGGGVIKINKEGKEIAKFLLPESDEDIRKTILVSDLFVHSTVVFKKDHWVKSGGYDEEFGFFADWDLWLKIGQLGKFYNFQEFFVCYSEQEQSRGRISHDYEVRRKLMANIKLRNKYRNYYPQYAKSMLVCFTNYFYSFLPFRKKLQKMFFWLRRLIFGPLPYKYFNIGNKQK